MRSFFMGLGLGLGACPLIIYCTPLRTAQHSFLSFQLLSAMLRVVARLPRALRPRPNSWTPQLAYVRNQRPPLLHLAKRTFFSSPARYRKKDKAKKMSGTSDSDSSLNAPAEDPFDLSQLDHGISTALSRLKDDLSKLRAGGRFNTASLETLKVSLSKDGNDTVRLGDLAQVVPKGGRMVTILAAEEEVGRSHNTCLAGLMY